MNHLEDRVRRALQADVTGVATEDLLAEVHRGADRRRTRRAAVIAAAAVVAVVGVAGVATQFRGDDGARPEPPATQSPTPLPDGAAQGVIDVSVVSPDAVYRLTTNVGCVACSTIWRQDSSAEGGWTRLHDFEGKNAYGGKVDPMFGPVEYFAMAANGRDGWAWGKRLHSTHDGARTWSQVAFGPGSLTDHGHWVHLTTDRAWSLHRSDEFGTQLFWTPLGAEAWSTAHVPQINQVSDILTVGDHVVLEAADEGLASPRLLTSTDGVDWAELDVPCGGETTPYPAETALFVLCPDGEDAATVYRSTNLTDWEVFGTSTGVVSGVHPLSDDTVLIVGGTSERLLTPDGTTPVDLGLAQGEETFRSSSSGDLSFVTTFDNRLLVSTDGGGTWREAG